MNRFSKIEFDLATFSNKKKKNHPVVAFRNFPACYCYYSTKSASGSIAAARKTRSFSSSKFRENRIFWESQSNRRAFFDSVAKDLKLNYSSLIRNNSEFSAQRLWGTVVACAMATRSSALTRAALEAGAAQLSPQALEAAKTAAAIMGMNNIFYRFHHLSSNPKYATMPARLRMNGLRGHGVEDVDFELWCLAVSAVNGCGKCVDAHERVAVEKGATEDVWRPWFTPSELRSMRCAPSNPRALRCAPPFEREYGYGPAPYMRSQPAAFL